MPLQYPFFTSFSSSINPRFVRSHRFSASVTFSLVCFSFSRRLQVSLTADSFSTPSKDLQQLSHPFLRITFFFFLTRRSLASSMTRSIGTFQRFKHDDVMRATHSVSVISHSLHDCIGPNRVRPPHTAVHLLRPPLVPPPTRRFRRRQPADVDVAGSSPPSSSPLLPPPPSPPPPLRCCHRHRRSKRGPCCTRPRTRFTSHAYWTRETGVSLSASTQQRIRTRCFLFVVTAAGCVRHGSSLQSLFFLSLSSNAINTVSFFNCDFFLRPYDMIN